MLIVSKKKKQKTRKYRKLNVVTKHNVIIKKCSYKNEDKKTYQQHLTILPLFAVSDETTWAKYKL